jgi:hypothetical protein
LESIAVVEIGLTELPDVPVVAVHRGIDSRDTALLLEDNELRVKSSVNFFLLAGNSSSSSSSTVNRFSRAAAGMDDEVLSPAGSTTYQCFNGNNISSN